MNMSTTERSQVHELGRPAVSSGMGSETRSGSERTRASLRARGERGSSLIETAMVLPVLLLIVTGIYTVGIAITSYLMLTDGVNVGARLLAISRQQTLDPCALTVTAVENAAPNLAPASLAFTFVLNGTAYSGTTCSSASTTTGAAGNLVQGQPAKVTVTYPCNLTVMAVNYAPSCSLSAQTTEIVQ
jgi:Flp pilus assembly protein TadG